MTFFKDFFWGINFFRALLLGYETKIYLYLCIFQLQGKMKDPVVVQCLMFLEWSNSDKNYILPSLRVT